MQVGRDGRALENSLGREGIRAAEDVRVRRRGRAHQPERQYGQSLRSRRWGQTPVSRGRWHDCHDIKAF